MDIAAFLAAFVAKGLTIEAALLAAVNTVLQGLPAQEQQVLYDATSAAYADLNAGKSAGQAVADGWSTFYNEEKGVVNNAAKYIFGALVHSLAPNA